MVDNRATARALTLQRNTASDTISEVDLSARLTDMVILLGSPPKLATCLCSHSNDALWSRRPAFAVPSFINVSEARKPNNPSYWVTGRVSEGLLDVVGVICTHPVLYGDRDDLSI